MAGLLPELVDDFHDLPELVDDSYTYFSNDNNRTVRTFREQEIQRLQEHHMTEMQLAEHGSAAVPAAAAMEHQRDLVHVQEKEEQRLHREKKLQQLERILKQQHHQQREEDLEQEDPELYRWLCFERKYIMPAVAQNVCTILSGRFMHVSRN